MMGENGFVVWLKRIAVAVAVLVLIAVFAGTWVLSSVLERDFLTPAELVAEYDIEVATVGGGTVLLTRTEATETEGVWGLQAAGGYGQVTSVVDVRTDVVERAFRTVDGAFREGDRARLDPYAYVGTPLEAHGIGFEVVPVAGELGVMPAWRVDADRATWVLVVHGKGETRAQSLRVIPALHEAGFPILALTFRNDPEAAPSADGRFSWGREEWKDVEDAVRYARLQGASEIVLYAHGMGAEIAAMFLHESELVAEVVGAVLDSPILDFEASVDAETSRRGFPGLFVAGAKALATLRFDIDWRELDQVERAGEFDVPILLLHGDRDDFAPVSSSDAFAAARPDIVRYERFEGAGHSALWNADPLRYETAVTGFLLEVAAPVQ